MERPVGFQSEMVIKKGKIQLKIFQRHLEHETITASLLSSLLSF